METHMSRATTSAEEAAAQHWDAIILGAGPAGAMTALHLARRRRKVLLCDKELFPRPKVCGGCLNAQSMNCLEQAGISRRQLLDCGGRTIDRFHLLLRTASASIQLPEGIAISRDALDEMIVEKAINNGCAFLDEVRGSVEPANNDVISVRMQCRTRQALHAHTNIAIVATGLTGRAVEAGVNWPLQTDANSKIGVAMELEGAFADETEIRMICGRHGYVGLCRMPGNRTHLAAAIEVHAARSKQMIRECIQSILHDSKQAVDLPGDLSFRTVPSMTRRLESVAFSRMFVLGDAAGYVEPFTGQGIAWACHGAQLLAPIADQAIQEFSPICIGRWQTTYEKSIRRQQRACRIIRWILPHEHLSRWAISLLGNAPFLAQPAVRSITGVHLLREAKA